MISRTKITIGNNFLSLKTYKKVMYYNKLTF